MRSYTNQNIIDAFFSAGQAAHLSNPWELLAKAGLDLNALAQDRSGPYRGPAIDDLPNLSDAERALIKAELPGDVGPQGPQWLKDDPDLLAAPLAPPDAQQITLPAGATDAAQTVAGTWNRYGGLLLAASRSLQIDPAIAVAVLGIESGGSAFGPSGQMIIRFENHIFWSQWGAQHADVFGQCFKFFAPRSWQGHQFRPDPNGPWQPCHINQHVEWQAFNLASSLDVTAARLSISMGAPQIMGLNYAAIGYQAVEEMFDAFNTGERQQIIGFFDFLRGNATILNALRAGDLLTVATQYNGPGQAARYAELIQGMVHAFNALVHAT